jgi:hypothetical protein
VGVFTRPDSPWWWLWLENAPPGQQKEKTQIRIGATVSERTDSKLAAQKVYAQRVLDHAARIHKLPTERPTIRFAKYADLYERDILPQNKGKDREFEILRVLRAGFGSELLHTIDKDRVRRWMTARAAQVNPVTVNREVDLLKAMLRDAVPKYIEASPIVGMKRLKTVKPKRRLLSPVDEKKLLKAATDPVDRALLILGIDTLQRMGDLLDLQRDDRRGSGSTSATTKNAEALDVPLSPRAAKALDAITTRRPVLLHQVPQRLRTRATGAAPSGNGSSICAGRRTCQFGKPSAGSPSTGRPGARARRSSSSGRKWRFPSRRRWGDGRARMCY